MRPGQIGSEDDALALDEQGEIFRGAFESERVARNLQRRHSKHLSTDLEHKVVSPLNLLGGAGKFQADRPHPLNGHFPALLSAGVPIISYCISRIYGIPLPVRLAAVPGTSW